MISNDLNALNVSDTHFSDMVGYISSKLNKTFFILTFDYTLSAAAAAVVVVIVCLSAIHWTDDALSLGPAIYDGYFFSVCKPADCPSLFSWSSINLSIRW